MEKKKTTRTFRVWKWLIRLFYGKVTLEGLDDLPDRDAVIVANHCQMNGPIVGEIFLPDNVYIWCAGQMMKAKEVPGYAFRDFWSQKPKWTHPFYKILSHLIVPVCVCLFNNARTVPVYHDSRVLTTFQKSVKLLQKGANLLIFPEKDEKGNNILYAFQENYIDLAKLYYKRTGKALTFVPLYIAPRLKKAYFAPGVTFDPDAPMEQERRRLSKYLFDTITHTARELPEHTVVPYRNIPRKNYPTNKEF